PRLGRPLDPPRLKFPRPLLPVPGIGAGMRESWAARTPPGAPGARARAAVRFELMSGTPQSLSQRRPMMMKSLKVGPAPLTGVCMLIGMAFGLSGALAAGHVSDVGSPSDGQHAAVHRPVSDFVSAQGSTNSFIPPIPDFIAWTDNPPNGCNATKFASVDYAGVAAAWLEANGGPSLGTHVGGSVTERPLADGRADVIVVINTSNALSWAVAFPITDLATDPTIFGNRANEILANPSLQPGLSTC